MKKCLLFICFLGYFLLLLYLLFFSAYRQSVEGEIAYNLIPFKTIGEYFLRFDGFRLTDPFLGNILAFVPFGFFVSSLFRRMGTLGRIVFASFILSLSVEVLQFLFRVGAFDVDDLLVNALGGGLGYCLYSIISKSTSAFITLR